MLMSAELKECHVTYKFFECSCFGCLFGGLILNEKPFTIGNNMVGMLYLYFVYITRRVSTLF